MGSARAGLRGGQFGGVLEGGSDKKDILMTGPASLVALVDLFKKALPNFRRDEFGRFPSFRILFFSLPTDTSGKEGDAVGGFGAVALRLIGPLHRPAHGGRLKFAAGDGFAGETFGFFDAFLLRLGGPIIPRFSKGGVFPGEVDGSHLIGRKDLGKGIFSLGDEEVNLGGAFIVTENKTDYLVSVLEIQGDVTPIVECSLKGVLA